MKAMRMAPAATDNISTYYKFGALVTAALFLVYVASSLLGDSSSSTSTSPSATMSTMKGKYIKAATWNIAAVNNNPFEYWITNDDAEYNNIMKKVSEFIENTGDKDVKVEEVFTQKMFDELAEKMKSVGWEGVDKTREYWKNEYKDRKIISEFIKDPLLGKKRLASMPDRVTNTINLANGGKALRPTVINCYKGDLSSNEAWWPQWKAFYFDDSITLKKDGKDAEVKVFSMVPPISKSKYPSITEEEAAVSVPLETLCMAIFDAILVHMMNKVGPSTWEGIRADICLKLNEQKSDRTVQILSTTYADSDVEFLQEVAGNFATFVKDKEISKIFDLYYASDMDPERDQNSFVLLKKGRFTDVKEITSDVVEYYNYIKEKNLQLPVVAGDLVTITATDVNDGTKYMFSSFHGDTNGLATIPVVTAVKSYAIEKLAGVKMLFGLDANTYAKPEADQQGVTAFAEYYTGTGINSCYGPTPNPLNFTTFHARTHLQPQLNKAVSLDDKDAKGDKNPKDFILFLDTDYKVISTSKDNTGDKKYIDGMIFPTLSFPSDHGVTSTVLLESSAKTQRKLRKSE